MGKPITWRVHLRASREAVFDALATDDGRARFWAESAREEAGVIAFRFPNGAEYRGRVVTRDRTHLFAVEYFGGIATFSLHTATDGGTDLTLQHDGVPDHEHEETSAGWVSVLMQLKAAIDGNVDLRNHDATRTWDQGYVDN